MLRWRHALNVARRHGAKIEIDRAMLEDKFRTQGMLRTHIIPYIKECQYGM